MFKIISKKRYNAMMDELKSNQTKITEAEQERLRIVGERNDALMKQQVAENDAKEKSEKIEAQRIELSKLNEKVIGLQRKNTELEGELRTVRDEKALLEKDLDQSRQDFSNAFAEKTRLQQELDGCKPKRNSNGRFTSKKAKKESE
ncbi:MAG: hypothetical protein II604_00485 [Bacteroidales bacterium]|nr:hypothetical protein [Bacteroidales bacterium]